MENAWFSIPLLQRQDKCSTGPLLCHVHASSEFLSKKLPPILPSSALFLLNLFFSAARMMHPCSRRISCMNSNEFSLPGERVRPLFLFLFSIEPCGAEAMVKSASSDSARWPMADSSTESNACLQCRCANWVDQYGWSVRPVSSGQLDEDPTKDHPRGIPSGQAHFGLFQDRQAERPQTPLRRSKNMYEVGRAWVWRRKNIMKSSRLICFDWLDSQPWLFYLQGGEILPH